MKSANSRNHLVTAALALALTLAASLAPADPPDRDGGKGGITPPNSHAYGKTLAEWQELWFRWAFAGLALPTDHNGNAVSGHVVLMPIPNTPGDGTPGSLNVTLDAGQPFVLPLFFLFGNSYVNGSPDDALVSPNDFRNINLKFKVDGVTVINGYDAIQNYFQNIFNPPIPITDSPWGFSAYIWIQGLGIVHTPLSVGRHTLKLDVTITIPEYGFTAEYHNTWNVTVVPPRHP